MLDSHAVVEDGRANGEGMSFAAWQLIVFISVPCD